MTQEKVNNSHDYYNKMYGRNISKNQKKNDWITAKLYDNYGNVQPAKCEVKRGRLCITAASELAELMSWWG